MKDFTARFAGFAMLTLAAVPLVAATATIANAAPAAIRIADLDLASTQGKAAFEQRTAHAARDVCRTPVRVTLREASACQAAVKAEAHDKLAAVQNKASAYAAR
jgi:UrcA family protein